MEARTSDGGKYMADETIEENTRKEGMLSEALNFRIKKFVVNHPEQGFKSIRDFVRTCVEEKLDKLKAE
jgi:hypothetical protein